AEAVPLSSATVDLSGEEGGEQAAPAVAPSNGEAPERPRIVLPAKPAAGALLAGLLAAVMVAVMGNLVGAQEVFQQHKTFSDFDYFTAPTRIIHDTGYGGVNRDAYGDITEFPLFSFLLNDMHPHVMALPLMLLGLALALGLL